MSSGETSTNIRFGLINHYEWDEIYEKVRDAVDVYTNEQVKKEKGTTIFYKLKTWKKIDRVHEYLNKYTTINSTKGKIWSKGQHFMDNCQIGFEDEALRASVIK